MTQSSEQGFLTLPTGEKTDVCLDLFDVNPHRTYDAANDKTRIFLGYDSVSGKQLNVLVLGGYIGDASLQSSTSVGAVLQPTIEGNAGEQYVDIDGDLPIEFGSLNFSRFDRNYIRQKSLEIFSKTKVLDEYQNSYNNIIAQNKFKS